MHSNLFGRFGMVPVIFPFLLAEYRRNEKRPAPKAIEAGLFFLSLLRRSPYKKLPIAKGLLSGMMSFPISLWLVKYGPSHAG